MTAVQRAVAVRRRALLLLAGVFLMRAETSYLGAALRFGLNNPGSAAFGLAILAGAASVSLVLATDPGAGARDGTHGALLGVFTRNLDVADAASRPTRTGRWPAAR